MPFTDDIIANMALGHVGVGVNVGNLETDNSSEGQACRRYINSCRDVILEMKPWAFCTMRWTLQELPFVSTDHFYGHFAKKYVLPSDCIRPDVIINPAYRTPPTREDKIPFKVVKNTDGSGGSVILTDQATAVLEGNMRDPSPSDYSATFAEGQSLYLGVRISTQLRVNANMTRDVRQQWSIWQAEAILQDTDLGTPDAEPISSFQQQRG